MKKIVLLLIFSIFAFSCAFFSACSQKDTVDGEGNNEGTEQILPEGNEGQEENGGTEATVTPLHYASAHCDGVCDQCGETMYKGDMSFKLSDNQNYYIVSGDNLSGDVVLPAYYKDTGDDDYLPVLEAGMLNGEKLSSVAYHKNIESARSGIAPNLTKITVDSENPILKAKDGVLFSDKGKKLVWYPALCDKDSYTVPSDCIEIDYWAFSQVTKLGHLTVPQSVVIVSSSFIYESTIDRVEILCPVEDLNIIGSSFREVKIDNIQNFPEFENMQSLEKASVKGSYEEIGLRSFWNCVNLREVELSDSYKKIETQAFDNCTSLKTFSFSASVTQIRSNAFSKTGLTQIEWPAGVATIASNTFQGCTALTEFTIPETVQKIEFGAFSGCAGLTEIIIPATVTDLSEYAFSGCANVKKYISYATTLLSIRDFQNLETLEIHNADEIGLFYMTNRSNPVKIYLDNVKVIIMSAFKNLAPGSAIFIKETSRPVGWDEEWCDDSVTVHWGATF